MTFPTGALPDQGLISELFRPFKSAAFTGGGVDLDLTDPANLCTPCASEFICETGGNLVAVLAGDIGAGPPYTPTSRTYVLNAGDVVYGVFVLAKSTSTVVGFFRQ